VKGFKKAMNEGETEDNQKQIPQDTRPDADFGTTKPADGAKDTKNA
jgi:Sec-independent protein translocase protein TatA